MVSTHTVWKRGLFRRAHLIILSAHSNKTLCTQICDIKTVHFGGFVDSLLNLDIMYVKVSRMHQQRLCFLLSILSVECFRVLIWPHLWISCLVCLVKPSLLIHILVLMVWFCHLLKLNCIFVMCFFTPILWEALLVFGKNYTTLKTTAKLQKKVRLSNMLKNLVSKSNSSLGSNVVLFNLKQ